MAVLQQVWLYEIIGGTLPMCQNITMRVNWAWIKRYGGFFVQKHITPCTVVITSLLVREKPLGSPASVKRVYWDSTFRSPLWSCDTARFHRPDILHHNRFPILIIYRLLLCLKICKLTFILYDFGYILNMIDKSWYWSTKTDCINITHEIRLKVNVNRMWFHSMWVKVCRRTVLK